MKYFVTVDGEEHTVELVERLGKLQVRFDDEPLDAEYGEVDRLGQVGLFLGNKAHAVSIEGDAQGALVTVAGHHYTVRIEDERERAASLVQRGKRKTDGTVRSVMPGVVVQLLVEEGQAVAKHEPLVILEAMKMQNEIKAPTAGIVQMVHVTEGAAVGSEAKLVTLKAEPG